MRERTRTRDLSVGAMFLTSIVTLGLGQSFVERAAVLQAQGGVEAPMFEVDPLWPQPPGTSRSHATSGRRTSTSRTG